MRNWMHSIMMDWSFWVQLPFRNDCRVCGKCSVDRAFGCDSSRESKADSVKSSAKGASSLSLSMDSFSYETVSSSSVKNSSSSSSVQE